MHGCGLIMWDLVRCEQKRALEVGCIITFHGQDAVDQEERNKKKFAKILVTIISL